MPRSEARINCTIWQNEDFLALTGSQQRTYFLVVTQGDIALTGVIAHVPARWATRAVDTDRNDIDSDLAALEDRGFVLVDEDTCELWVRTFSYWDGVTRSVRTRQGMWTAYRNIASETIRRAFIKQYADELDEAISEGWITQQETPPDTASHTPPDTPSSDSRYPMAEDISDPEATPSPSPSPSPSPGSAHTDRETNLNGTPRRWDQDWRQVLAALRGGSNRPIPDHINGTARAAIRRLGGMRQLGSLDPTSAKFEFRDAWKEIAGE